MKGTRTYILREPGDKVSLELTCPEHGPMTITIRVTEKGMSLSGLKCPQPHDFGQLARIQFSLYEGGLKIEVPE